MWRPSRGPSWCHLTLLITKSPFRARPTARAYPSAHQLLTICAYSLAASSQVKWPASIRSSLLLGSPVVEKPVIARRHRSVPHARDDLHRGLDLREQLGEDRKARLGADVARRLDEAVAVVGGEVVLPDFPVPDDAPWKVLAPPGRVKKGGAQMSTTVPEQDPPLLRLPKRSSRT